MRRTLSELAQEAIQIQNACNLSGLVHGFSQAISALRECLPEAGTQEINTHPICVLWSYKLYDLAGGGDNKFTEAYNAAKILSKGNDDD